MATNGYTPLPHSWFIYAIFYIYIAFYICAFSGKSPLFVGITFFFSSCAYFLAMSCILHFPSYWWLTILSVNLGYFIALYEGKITEFVNKYMALCYSFFALALFISYCAMCKIHFLSVIPTIIWIFLQAFSIYIIVRTFGLFQWKWLRAVGVFSLELYLVHGIPLMIGEHFLINDYLLWAFTYCLAIPTSLLLNKITLKLQKKLNFKLNNIAF